MYKANNRIILYTQRVEVVASYQERRDCADQRIPDFIFQCGYLPIPLPNHSELALEAIEQICPLGIILTGGNSLVKYGGNAPERDEVDKLLIQTCVNRKLPLYGFCRGMQSILDFFSAELVSVDGHVARKHVITGELCDEVNSYHNQACLELSEETGLKVRAKSDDGVIEAVCHKEFPIFGTMWHPERENPYREKDIQMIKEIFG